MGDESIKMRRVQQFERTDRDIREAFLRILYEKPFEKITVQDIITEAMINRSTFYQHYEDKYAIVTQLQEMYVGEITQEVEKIQFQGKQPLEEIDRMMENYFSKKKNVFKVLLKIRSEHIDFQGYFKKLFMDFFSQNWDTLEPAEANMISEMFFAFFMYFMEHDEINGTFSSVMFQNYFNITLKFFRMNSEEAKEEFMELLKKYAT